MILRTLFRPLHGNFNPIRNIFRVAGQAAKGKRERRHKTAGHRRNYAKRRMLRIVTSAVRGIVARTNGIGLTNVVSKQYPLVQCGQQKSFSALSYIVNKWNNISINESKPIFSPTCTENILLLPILPLKTPARTVIKFSRQKGKRKSVKTVLKRFYRLHWGIWIRTLAGRHKKLWRKSSARKRRLRQHVFCNATQSTLLDKMVTAYWRRPHYYVNDPYNPYHKREEFPYTRKTPVPLK